MLCPEWADAVPSCLSCHPVHHAGAGTCSSCHGGDGRTSRKDIAHQKLVPGRLARYLLPGDPAVSRGNSSIDAASCRRCHTIGGRGNRLAGNLDRLVKRHPLQILNSIITPVEFMPDFRFDDATASEMVNAVMANISRQVVDSGDTYKLVRFISGSNRDKNLFEKRCGGCHRILNRKTGPHGKGVAGPNLSGLLTGFYPKNSGNGKRWHEALLEKWLQNPRKLRPNARMQPVKLDSGEFRGLMTVIDAE